MQGAEERRLRRISHTSQGGAIEGNPAGGTDDALMVDQGPRHDLNIRSEHSPSVFFDFLCIPHGHSHGTDIAMT